ncbi:MAG: ABC transporter substrate-binding protein [Anaerovoracaceae bacterium]
MKMKKMIAAAAAAALLLASFAGCGSGANTGGTSAGGGDMTDVSMAFCTWTGYAPMFIAKEKGYFADAGINMDIQIIEDESTYASLLTNNSVQFLATALDPNIKMFANGTPSRYLLTMDSSNGADGLVAVADIKTLDDLRGRTVALDKSASSYYFFLKALESGSTLTEADIEVIDMGDTTQAGLAFMSGQVDAAIMWEPELSEALESVEGAHAVITSADLPDTILDSLVVNADFAAANPEIVSAVENAWYQAVDFMNANPEEAYELMAGGFDEVSAEDIAGDVQGLSFMGKAENEAFENPALEDSAGNIYTISQSMADFWMSKGECSSSDLTDFFALKKQA